MKTGIKNVVRHCFALALVVSLVGAGSVFAADLPIQNDTGKTLQEMPVLTGAQWQVLQPDAKVAFIWGIGHVVTIEENVIQKHPELKRVGFTAKLAEGLKGVSMDTIIQRVDGFYRDHPEDGDLPVLGVIWAQLVRPNLKAGIADRPFASSTGP
ncbi:hypothetical protein GMLC_15830 [Geomonas limicola]|uniref:TraB/GumN family protein n=1 Tax=Geomonas limicola TaxID=2740186 RepID=A0A6V8N7S9_9BACT|nr:hypothetical protein [Geomonas limicola]GFO68004.1 hypothetical protein GMLC_15830 [Geomonas limicola]